MRETGSLDHAETRATVVSYLCFKPPMNKSRVELVNKAFNKLDKNQDGKIEISDLKGEWSAAGQCVDQGVR